MSLLQLPAELRNQIYQIALVQPSVQCNAAPKEPPLLLVNRQLRHETLLIFYGNITFSFINIASARSWLDRLHPDKLGMLRSVHASSGRHEAFDAFWTRLLKQARKELFEIWKPLEHRGLRDDVARLPVRVEDEIGDESGVTWINHIETGNFVERYRGFVEKTTGESS